MLVSRDFGEVLLSIIGDVPDFSKLEPQRIELDITMLMHALISIPVSVPQLQAVLQACL